jgi:hypothetical protein
MTARFLALYETPAVRGVVQVELRAKLRRAPAGPASPIR